MALLKEMPVDPAFSTTTIRLTTSGGQIHYVQAYNGETMGDIKSHLHAKYGYDVEEMAFFLYGKEISDSMKVNEIKHSASDYLVLALTLVQRYMAKPSAVNTERQVQQVKNKKKVEKPRPERESIEQGKNNPNSAGDN
jgi:predicted GIY-YIG superfamily endonuclease